jgi:hypothetical protein
MIFNMENPSDEKGKNNGASANKSSLYAKVFIKCRGFHRYNLSRVATCKRYTLPPPRARTLLLWIATHSGGFVHSNTWKKRKRTGWTKRRRWRPLYRNWLHSPPFGDSATAVAVEGLAARASRLGWGWRELGGHGDVFFGGFQRSRGGRRGTTPFIVAREGIRGTWRGLHPPAIGCTMPQPTSESVGTSSVTCNCFCIWCMLNFIDRSRLCVSHQFGW